MKVIKKKIAEKALPIFERVLSSIWSVEALAPIPLMTDGNTSYIRCDFKEAVATRGASIIRELERQTLLTAIDKLWSNFINEINSYLIPQSEYKSIYQKMYVSAKEDLRHTLLTVTLPINDEDEDNLTASMSRSYFHFPDTACDTVGFEELCPCGSGKPYWQCHGRLRADSINVLE